MSVYTPVNKDDLQTLADLYEFGQVRGVEGIEAGAQNTNYFLYTDRDDYVLTIVENIDRTQVQRAMQFMHFLSQNAVPSSDPLLSRSGRYVETLHFKPVVVVKRVRGHSVEHPSADQLRSLAEVMARWHLAVLHYSESWPSRFDQAWRQSSAQQVLPRLSPRQRELLTQEMAASDFIEKKLAAANIPQGIIHSDVFRDNVLYQGSSVAGVIDLYDIHYGPFVYDMAILINDWCRSQQGRPDEEKLHYFLHHYQIYRKLTPIEIDVLPEMLKKAALRFWLARTHSYCFPKQGQLALRKDPQEYEDLLRYWKSLHKSPVSY